MAGRLGVEFGITNQKILYPKVYKPSFLIDPWSFGLSGYHNLLMICTASINLPNLTFWLGQSNPKGTSFIDSPVPSPNPMLLGYSISSEAKT